LIRFSAALALFDTAAAKNLPERFRRKSLIEIPECLY
jgi:hypothetical protein